MTFAIDLDTIKTDSADVASVARAIGEALATGNPCDGFNFSTASGGKPAGISLPKEAVGKTYQS